ncbi:MAG: hypothetical protein KIT33_00645 [Candidatus Kapabacteria bacterium]|nr:hypothetical protein [Ignavibacteriota bacterium]MCW5883454.1 hypothetical protein [Candidatus Kapabacteria bacterium]
MKKIVSGFKNISIKVLFLYIYIIFINTESLIATQFTPILLGKTKDTIFKMRLVSADLKITCNEQRISFDWLLTYNNPLDEWIEGELSMPMLNNQLITAFDMNVGDVLRKGMIAEKMLAKSTYERIVARNNDPGLLEIVKGNSIKLRVFPIMEKENKRVRISYDCDFDYDEENQIFKLDYPFDFMDNLEYFNIELDASNVNSQLFIESNINELKINQSGKSNLKLKDFKGSNFFKFMYRNKFEKPIVSLSKFENEKYFSALVKSPLSNLESKKANSITMFVDASLSQKNNNFRAEQYFIREYLKRLENVDIELIAFSLYELARVKFKVESGNSDEIIEYLNNIEYIGATNYGSIDLANLNSDIIMMLSNGVKNLGDCDFFSINKPVYIINSNPDFDESYCRHISEKSGGKFINLYNNDNLYSAVMSMFELSNSIAWIDSGSNVSDLNISKHLENPDIFRITGKFKSKDDKINLKFSDGTATEISLSESTTDSYSSVPRLWASDKVNSLMLESKIDTAEIVRLSKKHSFATKFSSFIVLETIWQYLSSGIDPPPDLKQEFDKQKAKLEEEEARYDREMLIENEKGKKLLLEKGKMELDKLKFNYYDYYKDLFEYFKNNQIEENIYFDYSLSTQLTEKEQTGFILPKPFFYEKYKFKILKSLTFLNKGLVIDSSDSFFKPKIVHEFDSIRIKLINNDSITFRYKLEKGKLNVVDLDLINEFRNKGIGFGDISIYAKDSSDKYLDTVYVSINGEFTETLIKQNNQIKDLLRGENKFYLFDNEKEFNTISYDIKAGQENKLILDTNDIKSYLEYGVIDSISSGLGTLTGFVKDEYGNVLSNAGIYIIGEKSLEYIIDSTGRFVIYGIEPGEYEVSFIKDKIRDMRRAQKYVVIKPNKITKLGLVHIFSSSYNFEEFLWLRSSESSIRGGRNDDNSTSYIFSQENLKAEIDSIFELAEKYLKEGDTTRAEILLSGVYDIDNEKASYMYKLSAYFCRVKNLELAIDAYLRSQYFEPDSIVRDFKLARIYEDCGMPDSALKLYEKLLDYSYLKYSYVINDIERRKLHSLVNKGELNEDEKIDLMIRTESYDFLHRLRLEVLDPNKFNPNWYYDNYFGGFRLTDPIEESSFVQKQIRPGKYQLKLRFRSWNHHTEITNKYRGRVIIERNIGSLNYSRQVIEVEADSLDKEFEIDLK